MVVSATGCHVSGSSQSSGSSSIPPKWISLLWVKSWWTMVVECQNRPFRLSGSMTCRLNTSITTPTDHNNTCTVLLLLSATLHMHMCVQYTLHCLKSIQTSVLQYTQLQWWMNILGLALVVPFSIVQYYLIAVIGVSKLHTAFWKPWRPNCAEFDNFKHLDKTWGCHVEQHKEDILWLQYIQSSYFGQYRHQCFEMLGWEKHFTKNQTDTNFPYLIPYTYMATLKAKPANNCFRLWMYRLRHHHSYQW